VVGGEKGKMTYTFINKVIVVRMSQSQKVIPYILGG